jgi:hypothetical protein
MKKVLKGCIWGLVLFVFGVWVGRGRVYSGAYDVAATLPMPAPAVAVSYAVDRKTTIPNVLVSDAEPASSVEEDPVNFVSASLLSTKVAEAAAGYIVFVDAAPDLNPNASAWPRDKVEALAGFYDRAVRERYVGHAGFESLVAWAAACNISQATPIFIVYDEAHSQGAQPTMKRYGEIVVITYGTTIRTMVASHGIKLALHELAHVWDSAQAWRLSGEMGQIVQNPHNYPTAKARDEGAHEDFAESVTAYLWPSYAVNVRWSDDEPDFNARYDEPVDGVWLLDRHDYVERLFAGEELDDLKEAAARLPVPVAYSDSEVEVPSRNP